MIAGALGEYVTNASVYEDSTNVFVPFYRQAGMRYAWEVSRKTGNIDAAEFFGSQSFHEDDYTIYYNNIKDNVAKRIASYKDGH